MDTGRFRIQAVSNLTGVASATLRAWERRYGIPEPVRTESGYRLYTVRDVALVRRIKELCAGGLSVAQAAELVRDQPQVDETAPLVEDPYQRACDRLLQAARLMDSVRMEREVRLCLTLGPALAVVERVFCPALHQIGTDWQGGMVSVAHEHMASEIVGSAVRDLLRLAQPYRPRGTALLCCFAEEDHALPLMAASFRFVEWGLATELLGARTPPVALGVAVRERKPDVVGLSVTIPPPLERTRELVEGYAEAVGSLPWVVGGAGVVHVQDLVRQAGGRVIAGCGDEVASQIGEIDGIG